MAVDTALKNQYSDNILLLVQQKTLAVAPTVFQKPNCSGEVSFQDQIAAVDADEKVSRNEVVRNTDPNFDRRKIVPRYFYKAPLLDKMDKVMMLKDPTNEVVQTNAAALVRAKDTVVCNAFFATAYSGKAGASANELSDLSSPSHIISAGGVGLNMTKIRAAKKILDQEEVEPDNRFFAITAEGVEDLLAITEATSQDYAQVKALVSGQPGTICGFNFVQSERLPITSTTRKCAAYHKNGVVLGIWLDLLTSIDIMPGIHFSAQVYAGQSYGSTRLEEKRVVEVDCIE
ncbi:MAG: phage capsid protein [Candidatus Omnitrophota bacterium]|jgi:hypothetical protein